MELLFIILGALFGALVLLIIVTLFIDCSTIRKGREYFPHRLDNSPLGFCKYYKYAFLYNFILISITGFRSHPVLTVFKALWLSDMIWLTLGVVSLGIIGFFPLILAVIASILYIPHSLLHCCLVRTYYKQIVQF